MTKYKIKIYSKNKEPFNHFLKFISHYQKETKNIQRMLTVIRKKNKIKKITVLKSPHVNKKAQRQFQFLIHIIHIIYFSWNKKKTIIFLKKIKANLFPDIKIKIEKIQSSNKKLLKINKLYNPLKFEINVFFSKKNLLHRTLLTLKILDNRGYFC